jgi:hypothetical protein
VKSRGRLWREGRKVDEERGERDELKEEEGGRARGGWK